MGGCHRKEAESSRLKEKNHRGGRRERGEKIKENWPQTHADTHGLVSSKVNAQGSKKKKLPQSAQRAPRLNELRSFSTKNLTGQAEKRLKKKLATDAHGRTRTLGLRPFEERFALGLRLEAKKKTQSRRSAVFLES